MIIITRCNFVYITKKLNKKYQICTENKNALQLTMDFMWITKSNLIFL